MTLRAGIDRVLILPDEVETQTESGLFIHHAKTENPTTGIIQSIGKGDKFTMEGIEVGDRVTFADMAGAEFVWEGIKYYCLHYNEVLAVLPQEADGE